MGKLKLASIPSARKSQGGRSLQTKPIDSGLTLIELRKKLRSGKFLEDFARIMAWKPRPNPTLIYPEQLERSDVLRRNMTIKDTEKIVYHARLLRGWEKRIKIYTNLKAIKLKENDEARCHILADSNIRIITHKIYEFILANSGQLHQNELTKIENFVTALTGKTDSTLVTAIKSGKSIKDVMDQLSHGEKNLFLGDADTNSNILHGFDAGPLEPTSQIYNAVRGLTGIVDEKVLLSSVTPTMQKPEDGGKCLSSYYGLYDWNDLVSEVLENRIKEGHIVVRSLKKSGKKKEKWSLQDGKPGKQDIKPGEKDIEIKRRLIESLKNRNNDELTLRKNGISSQDQVPMDIDRTWEHGDSNDGDQGQRPSNRSGRDSEKQVSLSRENDFPSLAGNRTLARQSQFTTTSSNSSGEDQVSPKKPRLI